MPTTPSTINYYIAEDGTLRDGQAGSIAQTPRIYYGTEYAVTLSFPPSTIAEGDQLQVAVNRTRTFFSSASATGDAPVAAVAKHDVTAEEVTAQAVTLTLSTNTRAMIDQVNGIDHPVRGFFGVHVLRGQSFVTLAVADALMVSLESGPDAISPSLPVVDYPTRQEAEALAERSENAAERAEEAAAGIVPPLKLNAPPTTSTSGSVGQLAVYHDSATNKDHLYHLCYITEGESATLYHWEECVLVSMGNVAGGYPVLDANGKVLTANLPQATTWGELGIVKVSEGADGLGFDSNGNLQIYNPSNAGLIQRLPHLAVTYAWLDDAVRNVVPSVRTIPAATTVYHLEMIVPKNATALCARFLHRPILPSLYVLPNASDQTFALNAHNGNMVHYPALDGDGYVAWKRGSLSEYYYTASLYVANGDYVYTDTSLTSVYDTAKDAKYLAHYIKLTIDFSHVQTYSFEDADGNPIVPLFTPNLSAGDVYEFICEWSVPQDTWLIYPQKQGAVADDFVMRGEVGAVNGVAPLNADGNVPLKTAGVTGNYIGAARMAIGSGAATNNVGNIAIGGSAAATWGTPSSMTLAIGNGTVSSGYGIMAIGKWNVSMFDVNVALIIGCGTSANARKNAAVFYTSGNVQFPSGNIFVQKGIQQAVTVIPAATTAYTLAEGVQHHTPEAASVYTLPAVTDATRTHECILTVKFSANVLTYEFQDSAGNTLVPLPLNGDIEDGSVVTFYCRYESLLSQWVIMPVMVGKEAQE